MNQLTDAGYTAYVGIDWAAEVEVAGGWAFTRGTYTITVTPKEGGSL